MAVLECKMCGGMLMIQSGSAIAECENCGRMQTIPKFDDERKIALLTRANRLRANNEFDKAAALYESIVTEFSEEPEAYWGLILCKYGIEYVNDGPTGKKIPTCHRTSYDSVLLDDNYQKAISLADNTAKPQYEQEALQLESIRKGIIEVSATSEPYDIFICYKETDSNGMRTMDSVIAQDIYQLLTKQGYRVFFSRITLEDKLGVQYEPYIFSALNSAKVMLVVGTQTAHFQAVWVRNEWSRYLQILSANRGEKRLFAVYKNMTAYDLPAELQPLQSLDYGQLGADQDLLRGIEKIIPAPTSVPVNRPVSASAGSVEAQALKFAQEGRVLEGVKFLQENLGCSLREAKDLMDTLRFGKPLKERGQASAVTQTVVQPRETVAETVPSINLNMIRHAIAPLKRLAPSQNGVQMRFDDGTVGEYCCTREGARTLQILARDPEIEKLDNGRAIRKNDNILKFKQGSGQCGDLYLFKNGTMQAANWNSPSFEEEIAQWRNIEDFISDSGIVIAVQGDGKLVYTKTPIPNYSLYHVEDNVPYVAIVEGMGLWGLRENGTVKYMSGRPTEYSRRIEAWKDITSISACSTYVAGLKSDGTVVQVTLFENQGFDVSHWQGIVDICATNGYLAGVNVFGEVLITATCGLDLSKGQQPNSSTPAFRLKGYSPLYKLPDLRLFNSKAAEFAKLYSQIGTEQQMNNPVRYLYSQVQIGGAYNVAPQVVEQKPVAGNSKNDLIVNLQRRKNALYAEKNNLKGLFSGKRRKEIDLELAAIEQKLKQELGML